MINNHRHLHHNNLSHNNNNYNISNNNLNHHHFSAALIVILSKYNWLIIMAFISHQLLDPWPRGPLDLGGKGRVDFCPPLFHIWTWRHFSSNAPSTCSWINIQHNISISLIITSPFLKILTYSIGVIQAFPNFLERFRGQILNDFRWKEHHGDITRDILYGCYELLNSGRYFFAKTSEPAFIQNRCHGCKSVKFRTHILRSVGIYL